MSDRKRSDHLYEEHKGHVSPPTRNPIPERQQSPPPQQPQPPKEKK